jgi:CubicO group peptidase (beta-lactamase class C family)
MRHSVSRSTTCFVLAVLWLAGGDALARDDVARLLADLERVRAAQGVPGVSLAVVSRDGVLWTGGLGLADVANGTPVTADTVFRIGSLTKFFTAAVLLQLQESGRLRLSDPVRRHAPRSPFTNAWEDTDPVRIEQLLEHTAGLPDLSKAEIEFDDPTPLSLQAGLAWRRDPRPLRWRPGSYVSYSNAGYCLAGDVIEQVTGTTYEDVVRARILEPLGMTATGFFPTEATRERTAMGYQADGATPAPWWHMIMRPFGGLQSTARDMAGVVHMLLDEGRVAGQPWLAPGSIARAELPSTSLAARAGLRFGYGLGLHGYFHEGRLFHGHSGDATGYLAHVGYDREAGLGYFIAINRDRWSALVALRETVESWIASGLPAVPVPPAARVSDAILQSYAGRYEPATARYDVLSVQERAELLSRVLYFEGRLVTITGDGHREPLVPVDETRFRREGEPVATSIFVRDDNGRLIFQEGESYVRQPDP